MYWYIYFFCSMKTQPVRVARPCYCKKINRLGKAHCYFTDTAACPRISYTVKARLHSPSGTHVSTASIRILSFCQVANHCSSALVPAPVCCTPFFCAALVFLHVTHQLPHALLTSNRSALNRPLCKLLQKALHASYHTCSLESYIRRSALHLYASSTSEAKVETFCSQC